MKQAVTELIRSTISHELPSASELSQPLTLADAATFLDLDIGILASPPDRYKEYAREIREEYIHVSDKAYREGRTKVLDSFLSRGKLFVGAGEFKHQEEEQARKNIAAEIARLKDLECLV